MPRASRLLQLALAVWLGVAWGLVARAQAVPEHVMKVTYLFNFMAYTQWGNSGVDKASTLNLCVLGPDNFGAALDNLEDKPINGAKLAVSRLSSMAGIKKCHLLFVTEREAGNLEAINRFVGDAPVLIVADTPLATEAAIVMSVEGRRLVFDVNMSRVRQGGLQLSSKVLQLARSTTF